MRLGKMAAPFGRLQIELDRVGSGKQRFLHEAGGWKIDAPDSLTADKLRDNVKNALTMCKDHKDQWPADENEAYRAVSHKILAAIMDQPLQDPAQKASDKQPATPAPAANPQ